MVKCIINLYFVIGGSVFVLNRNIKQLRSRLGLDQVSFGALFGKCASTIGMWEQGRRQPKKEDIMKMAEMSGMTFETFMGKRVKVKKMRLMSKSRENIYLPIMGTVKAGSGGIAYTDFLGTSPVEQDDIKGGDYFWLKVKGDSMANEILEGDLALVRVQQDVESGELAIVIISGDEGTIKRIKKENGKITLLPSNPLYLPKVYSGKQLEDVHIVGKVTLVKRKL